MDLIPARAPQLYRPLSGSEIRLIKIAPGDWDHPIVCELTYVSLDDKPSYVALSYAWGDASNTKAITINGQAHNITISLFSGLRHLRTFFDMGIKGQETFTNGALEDFRLWADAICINQNDEEEKNREVPRMRDIYSSADDLYAWLGENECERVYKVMDLASHMALTPSKIRELKDFFARHDSHKPGEIEEFWEQLTKKPQDEAHGLMGLAGRNSDLKTWQEVWAQTIDKSQDDARDLMEGLVDILLRRWFNRVWVIQEVALAAREPTILVGRAWCYPQALRHLCDVIFSDPRMNNTHHQETTRGFDVRLRLALEEADGPSLFVPVEDPSFGIATRLEAILRLSRGVIKATEPHDYLYGILGLVNAGRLPDELMPKYSKPYHIVYQEYAKFIFEHTGNLSLLLRMNSKIPSGPSWVPDFRSPMLDLPKPDLPIESCISFSSDGSKMELLGWELDRCAKVYIPQSREKSQEDVTFKTQITNFNYFLQDFSNIEGNSKDQVLEEWLTSEAMKDFQIDLPINELKSLFESLLSNEYQISSDRATLHAESCFKTQLSQYSTFITHNGIMAALQRQYRVAQEGDVMFAIRGAIFPLLLRPTAVQNEYEYLGFCSSGQNDTSLEISADFFSHAVEMELEEQIILV